MSQEVPFKNGFRAFCMCGPGITYFKWMKQTRIKGMYIDVGILKVAFLSVISIHADINELNTSLFIFFHFPTVRL